MKINHALLENQEKDTSTHEAFATIGKKTQTNPKLYKHTEERVVVGRGEEETFTVQNTWCVASHLLIIR